MLDNSLVHPYSSSRRKRAFILFVPLIADAGHESRKLTKLIKTEGYELRIVKRRKRAFEVVGLTWSVERTFAWIRRYRRMSKDYEPRVQTSETLIDLITIRLMLDRLVKT